MLLIRLLYCLEDYDKIKDNKPKWCLANSLAYRYLEKATLIRDSVKDAILDAGLDLCELTTSSEQANPTDTILGCILKGLFPQVAVKTGEDKYTLTNLKHAVDNVGLHSVVPLNSPVLYGELYTDPMDGPELNLIQPVKPYQVTHPLLNNSQNNLPN